MSSVTPRGFLFFFSEGIRARELGLNQTKIAAWFSVSEIFVEFGDKAFSLALIYAPSMTKGV